MREIEVKVKISDTDKAKEVLEDKGVIFDDCLEQKDRIFLPLGISYDNLQVKQKGNNILRLREQKGKVKFTLKQTLSGELDSLEAETIVENPEEMLKAIELLGFYLAVEVKKRRLKGRLGKLTFCVDTVENLGEFVEVEILCEENVDAQQIQKDLYNKLIEFGLGIETQVFQGYDTLMYFYLKEKSLNKE